MFPSSVYDNALVSSKLWDQFGKVKMIGIVSKIANVYLMKSLVAANSKTVQTYGIKIQETKERRSLV